VYNSKLGSNKSNTIKAICIYYKRHYSRKRVKVKMFFTIFKKDSFAIEEKCESRELVSKDSISLNIKLA
jgi:hypothetical protein